MAEVEEAGEPEATLPHRGSDPQEEVCVSISPHRLHQRKPCPKNYSHACRTAPGTIASCGTVCVVNNGETPPLSSRQGCHILRVGGGPWNRVDMPDFTTKAGSCSPSESRGGGGNY